MKNENRRAEYDKMFQDVDATERQLAALKKLPFSSVHPKKPTLQKTTAAARLYKEYATSYMNSLRILLNILRKVESEEQNELLRRLEEFA